MKSFLLLFLGLTTTSVFSQLYISSNSYLYAKDQVLFVNQDIDLQSNSHIYLRNESQLVQGSTSTSTNKGSGQISLYQEGTVDNYEYNFWCSPIGNASAATGNENFGITMLGSPTTVTATTPATIITSNNGTASPLAISSGWIFTYLSSALYSGWNYIGSASTIQPGQGFTMKGTSGSDPTIVEGNGIQNNPGGTGSQRYDFRGKPNDGNISVSVGTNQFTLTGNPYPSAMHVNAFLLDVDNSACNGIAYYWEQDKTVNSHVLAQYKGGYGTYSPVSLLADGIYVAATFDSYNSDGSLNTTGTSSGLVIERKYAPIGQGFFVKGSSNGTLTLKNAYRTYYRETDAFSQFERPENVAFDDGVPLPPPPPENLAVPHIKINVILNNEATRQIALAFVPEATDGVDFGIDAMSPSGDDLTKDAYFFLDDNKYVIQGVQFDVDKRIPLGVKATNNAIMKFYVPEIINFDPEQMIYLYDDLDGSYHDIKNGMYEVTLADGIYNNRFEITFTDTELKVDEIIKNDFLIVQDNGNQLLNILNPNLIDVSSIALYDITGRLIFKDDKTGTNNKYQFPTTGLSESVYIVEIKSYNKEKFSQKIIISNKKS